MELCEAYNWTHKPLVLTQGVSISGSMWKAISKGNKRTYIDNPCSVQYDMSVLSLSFLDEWIQKKVRRALRRGRVLEVENEDRERWIIYDYSIEQATYEYDEKNSLCRGRVWIYKFGACPKEEYEDVRAMQRLQDTAHYV